MIILREKRLWHTWKSTQEFRVSGQADVIYLDPPRALIIDAKRGRAKVETEALNLQLRTLAALLWLNARALCGQDIWEITVALAQHWSSASPPCVYDMQALTRATIEMKRDVEAWLAPGAKRTPNPISCDYCRAKGTICCPESTAASLPVPFTNPPPAIRQIEEAIQTMSGERLGSFAALCAMGLDCAKAEIRKRLGEGLAVDGWALKPGRVTETVTDLETLHAHFMSIFPAASAEWTETLIAEFKVWLKTHPDGLVPDFANFVFLRSLKCVKKDLLAAVRKVTGAKGQGLEAQMKALLAGVTESKTSEKILERE